MGWQDDPVVASKPKWESDPIVAYAPAAAPAAPSAQLLEVKAGLPLPALLAPSANPYSAGRYPLDRNYSLGDSASYRQTDLLTGIEERNYTTRVTRVDDDEDRVEYNDGTHITDLMGNIIKSGSVEYDAPVQFTPAEFQVGKKWTAAFHRAKDGVTSDVFFDMRIAVRETVVVPAGSFDTFKIEGRGWNRTLRVKREVNLWLVPGLNFSVKRESLTWNERGKLRVTERHELVTMRQRIVKVSQSADR